MSPKKGDYEILEIYQDENETKIIYVSKCDTITAIYSGDSCVQIGSFGETRTNYKVVGNKLLLCNTSANINQGGFMVNSNISIEYQQINSIYFPSKITVNTTMAMGGIKSDVPVEITFKNCKCVKSY
jgi:hypothetical protein